MDDFNYLQDDALTKWLDLYVKDEATTISFIEAEFLPRFERAIHIQVALSKLT